MTQLTYLTPCRRNPGDYNDKPEQEANCQKNVFLGVLNLAHKQVVQYMARWLGNSSVKKGEGKGRNISPIGQMAPPCASPNYLSEIPRQSS